MQSNLQSRLHVGIIMDGNGRWAARRNLPRTAGHEAGVEAIRRVVEASPEQGVGTLTLYAFSCDNWRRPRAEVAALMSLLRRYLATETGKLAESGTRLRVIGRRDRLPMVLAHAIGQAERKTAAGDRLNLRIAIDYSARAAILDAAARAVRDEDLTPEGFARLLTGDTVGQDVDLLVRTSGEQRLSDFLLWECAYAELYFTERLWPDFCSDDLAEALAAYRTRVRTFGSIPEPQPETRVRVAATV